MDNFVRFLYRHGNREIFYISIVYLLCVIPAAYHLPGWLGWENGFLENLQVLLLLGGMVLNFLFYRRGAGSVFLSISSVFWLCCLRELSWGRVFFPTGVVTETGPEFVRMSSLPHYELINGAIGLLILGIVLSFLLTFPWRKFFGVIPIPYKYFCVAFSCIVLAHCGEHTALLPEVPGMLLEELAEVMLYFWLVMLSVYYYVALSQKARLHFPSSGFWR